MKIVDHKRTQQHHQHQDSILQKATTMETANIQHLEKVTPVEVRLLDMDHHCATLSPKVTKRRDTWQDERSNERNLESRNLEKVTKSDREGVIGQKEKQPGARKSVQFSDSC